MIHCRHAHPMGESYCTECNADKACANERQRVLDMINLRLTNAASRDVRMAFLTLQDEIKKGM